MRYHAVVYLDGGNSVTNQGTLLEILNWVDLINTSSTTPPVSSVTIGRVIAVSHGDHVEYPEV